MARKAKKHPRGYRNHSGRIESAHKKANCAECPFKQFPRVYTHAPLVKPRLAVMGEAPGFEEIREGRYFVGASGTQLNAAFDRFDIPKEAVLLTNACQCRPFEFTSETEWKQAIKCCRPRLEEEFKQAGVKVVLAAGKHAFWAVSEKYGQPLMAGAPWAGAPYPVTWNEDVTYVPSVHPAYCLRGNPQYWPVFWTWLKRAWDLAHGPNPWKWQTLHYHGTDEDKALRALARIAKRKDADIGLDIENAGPDPIYCRITAIGVADEKDAVSIYWPPEKHFSTSAKAKRATLLLQRILKNPSLRKIAHNGYHDVLGLEQNVHEHTKFVVRGFVWDTILLHHVAGNTLLHNLGLVAQIEFACDAWKREFKVTGDHKGVERFLKAKPDELTLYNAKDTAILTRLLPILRARMKAVHNGQALYDDLFVKAKIAAEMQTYGVRMNTAQRQDWTKRLRGRINYAKRQIRMIARAHAEDGWGPTKSSPKGFHWSGFNPGSKPQLNQLFFDHLELEPVSYSAKTGEPSLTENNLLGFAGSFNPVARETARSVLRYRKWSKLYNTYVKDPPIYRGYFHPQFKVWGTKGGRWASEGPNFQNIPKSVRDLVIARPGHWIVEADYSQLELRIVALLSGDEKLLQWYAAGEDVHARNRDELFATKGQKLSKAHLKQLRTLAKRLVYGCNYGGSAVTIWASLVVDIPELTIAAVERFLELWYIMHPRIKRYQHKILDIAYEHDYVECPLSGRRQYFWGDVEPTKVLNFPIQGTGADIIDAACIKVAKALAKVPDTYLVGQVHDALLVDTKHPVRVARILKQHMEQEVELDGHKTVFPIDYKVGPDWKNCREFESPEQLQAALTYAKRAAKMGPPRGATSDDWQTFIQEFPACAA